MGTTTPEGTKNLNERDCPMRRTTSPTIWKTFLVSTRTLRVGMLSQSRNLRSQGAGPTKRPDG